MSSSQNHPVQFSHIVAMDAQSDINSNYINSNQSIDGSNATQRMDPSYLMDAFMGQYINMDEEAENLELSPDLIAANDLRELRPDTPSSRNMGRSAATMGEK